MASRNDRRAKIDKLSRNELNDCMQRFNVMSLDHHSFTDAKNREKDTERLLDAADERCGAALDAYLGLPTDVELSRKSVSVAIIISLLAMLISIAALTKGDYWSLPGLSGRAPTKAVATP